MDFTYVDPKKMKSLEDYAVSLVTGILSLKTMESFHIRAVDLGIMPEDIACRCNTIIWDLRRSMHIYHEQLESVLELIPDTFNTETIIQGLQKSEISRARQLLKKKKCVT